MKLRGDGNVAVAVRNSHRPRYALPEAMRGISVLLITWHHLSWSAPQSELVDVIAPRLMYFLYVDASLAVQVFLVLGGFALATATNHNPLSPSNAWNAFALRYLRLASPYLVMLSLLLLAAWLTRDSNLSPPLIDSFSWHQLAAHIVFLQDVLGYENFSAGTWYLCIDIQYAALFFGMSALVFLTRFGRTNETNGALAMTAVLFPLGVVSAWYWNRIPEGDHFVFYFLTSLVLGSLLGWTVGGRLKPVVLGLYMLLVVLSLTVDFRLRIMVALGTAAVIWLGLRWYPQLQIPVALAWLGKLSYCLFLIHYLVIILVLNLLDSWIQGNSARSLLVMLAAFFCSLAAAILLYFAVDLPTQKWLRNHGAVPNIRGIKPSLDLGSETTSRVHAIPDRDGKS